MERDMKKTAILVASTLLSGTALAENLEGVNRMICAASDVKICFETGDCYDATPWELNMPEFVVIDLKKKSVSTTKASGPQRSTEFSAVQRKDEMIYLQGIEGGRAFSFVIDEITGILTASVARDGLSVSVFGACTDTDI
jgi:hypothetical protein